jgi:hypothetical protein
VDEYKIQQAKLCEMLECSGESRDRPALPSLAALDHPAPGRS